MTSFKATVRTDTVDGGWSEEKEGNPRSCHFLLFLFFFFFFSFSPLFQNLYFSSLHEMALFSCLSPFSCAGSSWLLSLSSLLSLLSPSDQPPIDRVSPNRCLKGHEAVSFEAAEWSEQLTSRRVDWLGAAAVGSIPALVTSSLSLLFFSFSPLFQNFSIIIHQSLDPTTQAPRSLSLHACMNLSSTFRFFELASAFEHLSIESLSH